MSALRLVYPQDMTDAQLLSASVPETDHPEWSATTTYTVGQRVIRVSKHAIYQAKVAITGNAANQPPELDTARWEYVSATNRWKMFDLSADTQTTSTATISYVIRPGKQITNIAAFNVSGGSIRIRVRNPQGVVTMDNTRGLSGVISKADWYEWFFDEPNAFSQYVLLDVVCPSGHHILLDVTPASGMAGVGAFFWGAHQLFGFGAEFGAALGIKDYSIKAQDQFGASVFVERAFSRTARFQMLVTQQQSDQLFAVLTKRRAKPTLYVVAEEYESSYVYGFYQDFQQVIPFPNHSVFELALESLA